MYSHFYQDDWSVPLDKFAEAAGKKLETAARSATYEVFKSVIQKSPIDTGAFSGNWRVSKDVMDTSFEKGRTGPEASLTQLRKVLRFNMGGTIYLSNSTPYAIPLEYGYSYKSNEQMAKEGQPRQRADARPAPAGMVRLTLLEWSDHVRRAIQQAGV